jgi:hypothetical protein
LGGITDDSFSPLSRRGRKESEEEEGENAKASPSLKAEWEGFTVFPRTLSVEELG